MKRLKETARLQERNSTAALQSYYSDSLKNHSRESKSFAVLVGLLGVGIYSLYVCCSVAVKQVADDVEYLLKDVSYCNLSQQFTVDDDFTNYYPITVYRFAV